jgi:hypothetical protein
MNTKLSKTAYDRMNFQAEEARDLGLKKLAGGVFSALGSIPREEALTYNAETLAEDTYKTLWKIASDVVAYHNISNADISHIDGVIETLTPQIIEAIETGLGVRGKVGAIEEKVPGQK